MICESNFGTDGFADLAGITKSEGSAHQGKGTGSRRGRGIHLTRKRASQSCISISSTGVAKNSIPISCSVAITVKGKVEWDIKCSRGTQGRPQKEWISNRIRGRKYISTSKSVNVSKGWSKRHIISAVLRITPTTIIRKSLIATGKLPIAVTH